MNKYTLGLDIGVGSVGWAAIDQDNAKLIEFGSRVFDQAIEAKVPRLNRSARRTLRRKKWRKEQLKSAFVDFDILTKEEINSDGFLIYSTNTETIKRPKEDTVYHLRKKALEQKVTKRELFLCLYSICRTRGHFLMEDIDFSKDGIDFDVFKNKFYLYVNPYIDEILNKKIFEEKLLKPLFESKIKKSDLTSLFKNESFAEEESENILKEFISFILNYKADLSKIDNKYDSKKTCIEDIKKQDTRTELEEHLVELYDLIGISKILSDGDRYLCEVAIKKLNNIEEHEKRIKDKQKHKTKEDDHVHDRTVRNVDNGFPNGLYVKETVDILKKQKEYYPEITDEFIEVCSSIISTRIPYYVGPLSTNGKNAWLTKNANFKYSYDYSIKKFNSVDEFKTIIEWKKRMISHCRYLPEQEALPKGSFIGETFSIINEINNYRAIDENNNDYYLTKQDKINIFNNLYLKNNSYVKTSDIKNLLNLKEYGSARGSVSSLNNKYTLYFSIAEIIPRLKINNILEIFTNKQKVDELEEIILNINLFDEESSKKKYFENFKDSNNVYIYKDVASKLAKLKSSSFYNFSKAFIMNETVDTEGNCILDKLFEDNNGSYTNNLMHIIYNATDSNGNKKDFEANKYIKLLKENNKLSIDLLIHNGKPLMPISRITIRALNETLKMYNAILETYGIPERVVVETARGKDSIKDFSDSGEIPAKHYEKMEWLCNYLGKQLKENKKYGEFFGTDIEDWKELSKFYDSNKDKIELYIRQNGIDLLTGNKINLNNIKDYEIDHILPRGFGDDSMDDKMLTIKKANALKANRTPIEFLESPDAKDFTSMTVGKYETLVCALFDMRLISENKKRRLLLSNTKDVETFINQNLVDTRYVIREFISILNAYNQVNNYNTHLVAMKASFTNVYRKAFSIEKDRDLGDQHHALDAATICLTDKLLSTIYPNYDQRGNFKAYEDFIKPIISNENVNEDKSNGKRKLNNTIIHIYSLAYKEKMDSDGSLLRQIKETTPLYSKKVNKNWKGQFTDVNPHKPLDSKNNVPLTVIGMNNEKKSYNGTECVAVDFYKYKDKKGNRKYAAIHLPKVIIDSNGNINKEKYLKLVKDYYGINELIDENGELKENLYRFRTFKNDIIYDTATFKPVLFNIGSIAKKKLEVKNITIYSYKEIYEVAKEMKRYIMQKFDLKPLNKDGMDFSETNKDEIINYVVDNLIPIDNFDKYKKALSDKLKIETKLNSFCKKLVYYSVLINSKNCPPSIDGQNTPVVNYTEFSKYPDAEYVKLKYNILGIRFNHSSRGKLIVSSANETVGQFKQIKREKFYWNVSKYSV